MEKAHTVAVIPGGTHLETMSPATSDARPGERVLLLQLSDEDVEWFSTHRDALYSALGDVAGERAH